MAEETFLDQTLVRVDADSYQHYLAILDQPPSREGFERLMSAPKPWAEPAVSLRSRPPPQS